MKTELEQLKENAEQQFFKERMQELEDLIEHYGTQIAFYNKRSFNSVLLMWAIVMCDITVYLLNPESVLSNLATLIFWTFFIYTLVTVEAPLQRYLGKMAGAIETLKALGMLPDQEDGRPKKKKRRKNLFSWVAKAWQDKKEKLQKEAYA